VSFTESINDLVTRNENGLLSCNTNWRRVKLDCVARVLNGYPFESKHFSKEAGAPLIRIRDV